VTRADPPPGSLQLPPGPWHTVLDGLRDRFAAIGRERWLSRFARGRVLDTDGRPLAADAVHRAGRVVRYCREVEHEPPVPFAEELLHVEEHLVVTDKPHFLPVAPTGAWVHETLLVAHALEFTDPVNAATRRFVSSHRVAAAPQQARVPRPRRRSRPAGTGENP
jgi:tRNA pseudouridine32 synthase/23S rRNA pseudouridine746 synthase